MSNRSFRNIFHTIRLKYDHALGETAYEKQLMKRYLAFVLKMKEKKEELASLLDSCYHQRLLEEEISAAIDDFEQRLAPVFEAAERFTKTNTVHVPEFLALRSTHEQIMERYHDFYEQKLERINGLIRDNNERTERLHEWFEEEAYKAFLKIHNYLNDFYRAKENYSFDNVQFSEEVESMKTDWQRLSEEWKSKAGLLNETIQKTDDTAERMEELNGRLEDLQMAMDSIAEQWLGMRN